MRGRPKDTAGPAAQIRRMFQLRTPAFAPIKRRTMNSTAPFPVAMPERVAAEVLQLAFSAVYVRCPNCGAVAPLDGTCDCTANDDPRRRGDTRRETVR